MKTTSSTLGIIFVSASLVLASCSLLGWSPDTPVISQEVVVPVNTITPGAEKTDEGTGTETVKNPAESIAVWEQTNLAPSDTPRWIAEGWLYLPYTPTALAQASGNIILFFYASWSPSSIATDKDISLNKEKITKDLTILRVNFDDAEAMKQQYNITDQQTFVQVTNTGELIKKWRAANTLEDIIQQIKK